MKPAAILASLACGLALLALPAPATAQSLGFDSAGGAPQPIDITALNGIAWNQKSRTVTAMGNAKAVRGKVTVTADKLIAHYHPKPGGQPSAAKPATPKPDAAAAVGGLESGASQITELDAVGHVHIFTATDQAFADRGVYDMARHELELTGSNLKLLTPEETVTARDAIQYWSAEHKAVAIGKAVITGKDGRTIAADRLTGYFTATGQTTATPQTSRLRKVIANGHVVVHTTTSVASGDHGVYHPATGIAVLTGHVHITQGPNELAGDRGQVNVRTGIATLLAAPGHRVEGLVIPDSAGRPATGAASKSPHSTAKTGQ